MHLYMCKKNKFTYCIFTAEMTKFGLCSKAETMKCITVSIIICMCNYCLCIVLYIISLYLSPAPLFSSVSMTSNIITLTWHALSLSIVVAISCDQQTHTSELKHCWSVVLYSTDCPTLSIYTSTCVHVNMTCL